MPRVIRHNIICMKWGTKYPASDVNTLFSMVQRQLSLPHRFVCFTDDAQGLATGIEARPLPPMDLPPGIPERGWNKLATFAKTLDDLHGTALFLDLDVVLVDRLDCFFEYPGEFCIIRDWLRGDRRVGNSSVYRFEIGQHPEVLEYFQKNFETVRATHRNEQEYLSAMMDKAGALTFWPSDWCCSFKRHCLPAWPLNWFQTSRLPAGAKIVVFHGNPKPSDAVTGKRTKLRLVLPVPWVAEHWR
jgi:hypothetical protein